MHHHCLQILSTHKNKDSEMRAIYDKICKDNGKPTAVSALLLMEYYGRCRLYNCTKTIYEQAKEGGLMPDPLLLLALSRALEDSRSLDNIKYVLSQVFHFALWSEDLGKSILKGLHLCNCTKEELLHIQSELLGRGMALPTAHAGGANK